MYDAESAIMRVVEAGCVSAQRLVVERSRTTSMRFVFIFFFQAEDGIRDYKVTGVQTCALPISTAWACSHQSGSRISLSPQYRRGYVGSDWWLHAQAVADLDAARGGELGAGHLREIGKASCRGRVEISVGAVSLKKKKKK